MFPLAHLQGLKASDYCRTYAAVLITLTIEPKLYFVGEDLIQFKNFTQRCFNENECPVQCTGTSAKTLLTFPVNSREMSMKSSAGPCLPDS